MKKRSLLTFISTIAIIILSLTGCGNGGEATPADQNKTLTEPVQIFTLTGVGEETLSSMPKGFDVRVFQKNDEIITQILNNDFDLAIVPANAAAKLYQQSGGEVVAISPIDLNGWYIISNKGNITSQQISDLRGKTIVAYGQGGTGEAILSKLLDDNYINPKFGVRMQWVDTPTAVMDALKKTNTIGLLQEPFATQALEMSSSSNGLTSDIDLGALWEDKYGFPVPSDVLVANKKFVEKRSGDLELFITAFETSLATAKESSTAKLVFYGRSNRGIDLMTKYMDLMQVYDISLLGGVSPAVSFYYGIGE